MKTFFCLGSLWFVSLITVAAQGTNNAAATAIGIYDSRAVAYAHFWSATNQTLLKEKMSATRAAQKAGDTAKLKELSTALRAEQDQAHRQVFSTAPVDDALAVIKQRLPEIQKQAGVTALASKWDTASLKKYEGAAQIDVTDQLVREFIQPDEKQSKTIESIKKTAPIPLDQCEELIRKGEI